MKTPYTPAQLIRLYETGESPIPPKAASERAPSEAAGTVPVVAAVASGSPLWWGGHITPSRTGWYITRTENGFISWRAWGKGAWWKQIKGGWIESYTGDGCALRYDWQPQSRQSIDLDSHQLPDLANVEISHARERRTDKSKP